MGSAPQTATQLRKPDLDGFVPGDRVYAPTHAALCLAVEYCRLSEIRFEEEPVDMPPAGSKQFRDYVLGFADGIPKTPGWAARVTGVPTYTIKALAASSHAEAYSVVTESEMTEVVSQAAELRKGTFRDPRTRYNRSGGFIAGTVYDYEADQVIEGARVTITQARRTDGKGKLGTAITDDLGNFFMDWTGDQAYSVRIEKEGYEPGEWNPQKGASAIRQDFPMFPASEGVIWW